MDNLKSKPTKSFNNNALKVLIVDDEPDNILLIKTYLKKANVQLTTANGGVKAFQLAQEFEYDYILMDLKMPDQDGIKTCQLIRTDSKNIDSNIIALTASYDYNSSFSQLFNEFVGKPISKKVLFSKLSLSLMP